MPSRYRPLAGIKVLDLTHALAGPFATQILADQGADVVKVENPNHQDYSRWVPPFVGEQSHYFLAMNHGKRSIALDLRDPAGQATLLELATRADVLIDNFRPGVIERMGLDYRELQRLNPRLIQCSISGFGKEGSLTRRPAYDAIIQAMSGFMSVTGEVDGAPLRCGVSLGDEVAGIYAALAIGNALFDRERTGRGAVLDVPMLDCLVSMLSYYVPLAQASGNAPRATGSNHATIVPLGNFKTADGYIAIAATTEGFWRNLCAAICPDLASDPRFIDLGQRQRNRHVLGEILDDLFATRPTAEWVAILDAGDVPNGPVLDIPTLLASDIAEERKLFRLVETSEGAMRVPRYPVIDRIEGLPDHPVDRAPKLGEQSEQIVREWLGRDTAEPFVAPDGR